MFYVRTAAINSIEAHCQIMNKKAELSQIDRAMQCTLGLYMHGYPENFRESLATPMATFPEIFNWLYFRLML